MPVLARRRYLLPLVVGLLLLAAAAPAGAQTTRLTLKNAPSGAISTAPNLPEGTRAVVLVARERRAHTLPNLDVTRAMLLDSLRAVPPVVTLDAQGRTPARYRPTGRARRIYYVVARTPSGTLYESYVNAGARGFVPGFDEVISGKVAMGPVPAAAQAAFAAAFPTAGPPAPDAADAAEEPPPTDVPAAEEAAPSEATDAPDSAAPSATGPADAAPNAEPADAEPADAATGGADEGGGWGLWLMLGALALIAAFIGTALLRAQRRRRTERKLALVDPLERMRPNRRPPSSGTAPDEPKRQAATLMGGTGVRSSGSASPRADDASETTSETADAPAPATPPRDGGARPRWQAFPQDERIRLVNDAHDDANDADDAKRPPPEPPLAPRAADAPPTEDVPAKDVPAEDVPAEDVPGADRRARTPDAAASEAQALRRRLRATDDALAAARVRLTALQDELAEALQTLERVRKERDDLRRQVATLQVQADDDASGWSP